MATDRSDGGDSGSKGSGGDPDAGTDSESGPDASDGETIEAALADATAAAAGVGAAFEDYLEAHPVAKGRYSWADFKAEYYYDEAGNPPTDGDGEAVPFDPAAHLGFDPDRLANRLALAGSNAERVSEIVDERTVNVNPEVDEDDFFTTLTGETTVANRYDLEKTVPLEKKSHFREVDRYWVNKPYAFVVLFHSDQENEMKYYVVEPYRSAIEVDLEEFLTEKLRTAIKYTDEDVVTGDDAEEVEGGRRGVIERETRRLLDRYDLYDGPVTTQRTLTDRLLELLGRQDPPGETGDLDGIAARPEPTVLTEDSTTLTQYQVEKLLYVLKRDFVGYQRIDAIKHDINVEDVSCDGYNAPVFVYHTDHEQLITNVEHDEESLDDFVVKLAQRSGKGISKRQPQVDATLPDGSRAQLTLGREVSDHGTNYTIRQFKDVPFTPIDLINWNTFSLEEMAFLWLAIENHKSLIFAGGTASGKTTSLNAVSLFIPSNTKIVSIEDTREVELPQRNWIASVTRPSFGEDDQGDIDEFDLLEAALRQRPDYIVMGEVRGEEGRTLFQVMSTGHTTYTTFHADSVSEVLKRFTTDPINVSKTLFTALDLVSIQTQTRVDGKKVRRNRVLTEINHYDAENDEINVQDVFEWLPESDIYQRQPASNTMDQIMFDRGWSHQEMEDELLKRRVVLAHLIENGLNDYAQVAATIQAFINDSDMILTLIANDRLGESLEDLRGIESVLIDIDPEKEEMVPRPDPPEAILEETAAVLEEAEDRLLAERRGSEAIEDLSLLLEAEDTEQSDVDVEAVTDAESETGGLPDVDEDDLDDGVAPDGGTGDGEPR
jgi:flagellar protein FlaI